MTESNEIDLYEGAEIGIEEPDFLDVGSLLSDPAKYAYTGIIALSLNKLFNTQWDKNFNEKCLKNVIKHLDLPHTVEPIMFLILSGEINNSVTSFMDILNCEDCLKDNMSCLLQDLISVAVQEGEYDARWRVLIRYVANIFNVSFEEMEFYEITVVHRLTNVNQELTEEEKKALKLKERLTKAKRYAMIGLATIGGGALIGVSGGLAAPALLTFLGSSVGALSSAGIVFGTLFGAAGAGLTGYKMNKRVGEIEEFAFGQLFPYKKIDDGKYSLATTPQLDITIAIPGWIKDESEDNFTSPWSSLYSSREQYYLRYESSYLLELGRALEYFLTMAVTAATQEALKYTVLAGLVNAIAFPAALIGLSSIIDNPWGVCCRRSAQVGKYLAEVLLNKEHGRRPVTLIGYSLGARVIYYCLREMADRKNCEGIVQDAILIGAPCSANPKRWQKFTRVVAGNIINAYCRSDWLLRFLYRTLSWPIGGVAGLKPVELKHEKIKNYDMTHIVSGHGDYPENMYKVLKELGIRVVETAAEVVTNPSDMSKASSFSCIANNNNNEEKKLSLRHSHSDGELNNPSRM